MIFLGHLGLGDALASPARGRLPRREVLIGTVLPDFLDKPLYYAVSLATGKHGAELALVRGTRAFGHTFLLVGLVWLAGRARGSDRLKALALGMATHPVLDFVSDYGVAGWKTAWRGTAAFWPLTGWAFPASVHPRFIDHAAGVLLPYLLACEIVGAALLLRAWLSARRT